MRVIVGVLCLLRKKHNNSAAKVQIIFEMCKFSWRKISKINYFSCEWCVEIKNRPSVAGDFVEMKG